MSSWPGELAAWERPKQRPRLDPCGHLVRVLPVDRPVLELDHRVEALAAQGLEIGVHAC